MLKYYKRRDEVITTKWAPAYAGVTQPTGRGDTAYAGVTQPTGRGDTAYVGVTQP